MNNEIPQEKELKINLQNERNYHTVLEHFNIGQSKPHEQQNYFFDTPLRDLSNNKVACRIRIQDNKHAFLTLKGPQIANSQNFTVREELEKEISILNAKNLIKKFNINQIDQATLNLMKKHIKNHQYLIKICHFTNFRYRVPFSHSHLDIDKTILKTKTLYELEMEVISNKLMTDELTAIKKLLKNLNIPYLLSKKNKLEHALFLSLNHKGTSSVTPNKPSYI